MPSFEDMMDEVKRKKESLSKPKAQSHPQPEASGDNTPAAATTSTTTSTVAAVLASERRMEEKQKEKERQKAAALQQQQQQKQPSPPAIQSSPSAGSTSLAYSVETEFMADAAMMTSSSGEVSAEHQQRHPNSGQHQHQYETLGGAGSLATVEEYYQNDSNVIDGYAAAEDYADATATVCDMHRKLLHLLSHPELFAEAMEWQSKVDRGIDPSGPDVDGVGAGGENGIRSFDNEFNDAAKDETKDDEGDAVVADEGGGDDDASSSALNRAYVGDDDTREHDDGRTPAYGRQTRLIPPLPLLIFASDAEVVLPQAYTATQLFGIERHTGIELEAAAGIMGLCRLFQRWLALMPLGDHENNIDPPGVTVMRISGGRYRVTGAHRVVWRWMNKFSFQDEMVATTSPSRTSTNPSSDEDATSANNNDGADFDFGDLVTMTIIDVFETDSDGRLLSYCPTFDNRAVHKTQEVTERIRKGASLVKERIEVVARSPAGKSVNKVSWKRGKKKGRKLVVTQFFPGHRGLIH
jgi:hypothetical protein